MRTHRATRVSQKMGLVAGAAGLLSFFLPWYSAAVFGIANGKRPIRLNRVTVAVLWVLFALLTGCGSTTSPATKPTNPISAALLDGDYPKALQLAQASSDATSKFLLGRIYEEGWGVQYDRKKAAQYYQDAAKDGNVRAGVFLSHFYEKGWLKGGQAEKQRLLQEAADHGDVQARYLVLEEPLKNGKGTEAQAVTATKAAADAGDPVANLLMATMYAAPDQPNAKQPRSIPRDLKKAHQYLVAAGATRAPAVCDAIAPLVFGGAKDLGFTTEEVIDLLDPCLRVGRLTAMGYVGACMKNPSDIGCDPVRAVEYSRLAKRLGADDALDSFPQFRKALTPEQLAKGNALAEAVDLKKKTPWVPVEWYVGSIRPN